MIITTTYNLKIEGEFLGFSICPNFGHKLVEIRLVKPFGMHGKGDIIKEHYDSCVVKSSLRFNRFGNSRGRMIPFTLEKSQ